MGPPSYMKSVVDRNVVMRHITLFRLRRLRWEMKALGGICDVRATGVYQDT